MNLATSQHQSTVAKLAFMLGRPSLTTEQWEEVEQKLPRIDTEELFQVAQQLGVGALVTTHLAQHTGVPKTIAHTAESRRRKMATQNLFLSGELTQVLSAFEEADVDALPYKGPVLASRAYRDLASRSFSDLDIYIDQNDVVDACNTLESIGFERKEKTQFTPADIVEDESVLQLPREFTFVNDGVVVETRWQLGSEFRPFKFSFIDCWNRRTSETVAGQTIPAFSAEDLLLVLARHGAKHHWNRLGWVADIAALIENATIDWGTTMERATDLQARRVLETCLLLTTELTNATIPEWIHRLALEDAQVRQTVESTVAHLVENPETAAYSRERVRRHLFDLRLCDSWTERIQFSLAMLFEPQELDYEFLPLPKPLHKLYYGVRPARLLLAAGRQGTGVITS